MTKDKEMEKFINDLSHNSPNSDMFENVKDLKRTLVAVKHLKQ